MGGVQCSMGCCQSTLVGAVSLDEFLKKCDTGDVILFNNTAKLTYLTKCCTRSKWDHVGMVLNYSENPDERILIESAGCGVFLCYAKQRIQQCLDAGTTIGWRQLSCGPRPSTAESPSGMPKTLKQAIHTEAQAQVDKPYEDCFGEILKAVLTQDGFETPLKMFEALGFEWAQKGEDLNALFCSELVAHLLKAAKIIAADRDSNCYLPKDFSSASNAICSMRQPFELRTEKQIVKTQGEVAVTVAKQGATPVSVGGKRMTIGDMMSRGEEKRRENLQKFESSNWSQLTAKKHMTEAPVGMR